MRSFKAMPFISPNPGDPKKAPIPPSIIHKLNTKNSQSVSHGILLTLTSMESITDAKTAIYDAVGNCLMGPQSMVYLDDKMRLCAVWNGKTRMGVEVASGTYVALVSWLDKNGSKKSTKGFIGIKYRH